MEACGGGGATVDQLHWVFNACHPGEDGCIRIQDLASISSEHVDCQDVQQIMQIFHTDTGRVNFEQFCERIQEVLSAPDSEQIQQQERESTMNNVAMNRKNSIRRRDRLSSRSTSDMGVDSQSSAALDRTNCQANLVMTHELGSKLSQPRRGPSRKASPRSDQLTGSTNRKASPRCDQLTGPVLLVNTSSEEENDELEDSFDRKISLDLELAAPKLVDQPRLLVRGSHMRSTIRKHSSSSKVANIDKSPLLQISPIPRQASSVLPLTTPPDRLEQVEVRVSKGSIAEVIEEELLSTAVDQKVEQEDANLSGHTDEKPEILIEETENEEYEEEEWAKMEREMREEEEKEREAERSQYRRQLEALTKERDVERVNLMLRIQKIQAEYDKMKQENQTLKEQARLMNIERESSEEMVQNMVLTQEKAEEKIAQDQAAEAEFLAKIQQLTSRLEEQDLTLAILKEDNIVLRSQNKRLMETVSLEQKNPKFFKILGRESPLSSLVGIDWEDPEDIRTRVRTLEQELREEREHSETLKSYVEQILIDVMVKNPQLLEKN